MSYTQHALVENGSVQKLLRVFETPKDPEQEGHKGLIHVMEYSGRSGGDDGHIYETYTFKNTEQHDLPVLREKWDDLVRVGFTKVDPEAFEQEYDGYLNQTVIVIRIPRRRANRR